MLSGSSYEPLARLASKIRGEIKYHILHADAWITQLGTSTEESKSRLQNALNEAWPYALGIFEPGPNEGQLSSEGIFVGEEALKEKWMDEISNILGKTELKIPSDSNPVYGGRKGQHTEHLSPLVDEMGAVIRTEPEAIW